MTNDGNRIFVKNNCSVSFSKPLAVIDRNDTVGFLIKTNGDSLFLESRKKLDPSKFRLTLSYNGAKEPFAIYSDNDIIYIEEQLSIECDLGTNAKTRSFVDSILSKSDSLKRTNSSLYDKMKNETKNAFDSIFRSDSIKPY